MVDSNPLVFSLQPMLDFQAGQLRHPRHSKVIGPRQPEDDHDLYPLRPGQDCEGTQKPAGFLMDRLARPLDCNRVYDFGNLSFPAAVSSTKRSSPEEIAERA